jgi:tRNA threonylcarbamoyladenosine biosynthesis protein TsaE
MAVPRTRQDPSDDGSAPTRDGLATTMTEETFLSNNADQTRQWGRELAERLSPGDVVALIGELGAGKTVLAQGILKGLGVEEVVQSPSFIMAREYDSRIPAVHLDLYRLHSSDEFLALGFDEYMDNQHILIIEWAEKIEDILPRRCWRIRLSWVKDYPDQRQITYQIPDIVNHDRK